MIETMNPTRSIMDRFRATWAQRMGERYEVTGIDVSHHQGEFDWSKAVAAGHRFAWIRACMGVDFEDRRWRRNWTEAKALDGAISVGPYFFTTWDNADPKDPAKDAIAEAEDHVHTCERVDPKIWDCGNLRPAIDLELREGKGHQMTYDATEAWVHVYLRRLAELTGITDPVIYCNRWWIYGDPKTGTRGLGLANVHRLEAYPLWFARYKGTTKPADPIPGWETTIWQWTGSGSLKGHTGRIDLNRFMGTRADFGRILGGREPEWLKAQPELLAA